MALRAGMTGASWLLAAWLVARQLRLERDLAAAIRQQDRELQRWAKRTVKDIERAWKRGAA